MKHLVSRKRCWVWSGGWSNGLLPPCPVPLPHFNPWAAAGTILTSWWTSSGSNSGRHLGRRKKKALLFFFFFPYSESSFPEQAYQGIRCVPELDQEVLEDYIASSRGMDVSAPLIMEKDTCISLAIMWTSTWRYYQGHPGRGRRV